jgi:PncC family amidohydrolase
MSLVVLLRLLQDFRSAKSKVLNMLTKVQNYTKFTQDLNDLIFRLRGLKMKIGFAESCTGGRLSAVWAEVPGVSDVYLGSIISYSNQVKVDLLGVDPMTLQNEGAVSSEVARQMALGLVEELKVDWGVSITGVAGPSGGSPTKPVGTVWFGIHGPGLEETIQKSFHGSRVEIQNQSVVFATSWLYEKIKACSP